MVHIHTPREVKSRVKCGFRRPPKRTSSRRTASAHSQTWGKNYYTKDDTAAERFAILSLSQWLHFSLLPLRRRPQANCTIMHLRCKKKGERKKKPRPGFLYGRMAVPRNEKKQGREGRKKQTFFLPRLTDRGGGGGKPPEKVHVGKKLNIDPPPPPS